MIAQKRIVILTGSELQHRYVARALAELPNVTAILVAQQPNVTLLQRIRRAKRRFGLAHMLSRTLLELALRLTGGTSRRKADLARVLDKPELCRYLGLSFLKRSESEYC